MFSIYLVRRLATDICTFGIVIASAGVLVVPAAVAAVAAIPGVSIVVHV
jgi:hypothetical protein